MVIQVMSIDVKYREDQPEGVIISFTASNKSRTISVNGSLPLTDAEYEANQGVRSLETLVKQRVINELQAE